MKRRSVKQRANDRRLGRLAKARSTKVKSKRKSTTTMARRRKTTRRRSRVSSSVRRVSRSRGKLGGFLQKGIVGKVTSSLGAGMLVGLVTDRVAPQATPFATLGAEYLTGGITGLVAAEGLKSITGQPSILSNFIGGFGLGGSQGPTGGAL